MPQARVVDFVACEEEFEYVLSGVNDRIPVDENRDRPTRRMPQILREGRFPIQRVAQLDGVELDTEIESLLFQQVKKAFQFFSPGSVQFWKPELLLLLRSVMFRGSMWPYHTTYGKRLQNLTYRDEKAHQQKIGSTFESAPFSLGRHVSVRRSQLILYGLLSIGGRYGIERVSWYCAKNNWGDEDDNSFKRKFWLALRWIEKVSKLLDFINLLAFLHSGIYISMIDRILRMRLVPGYRSLPRQVSFEFMNRQLVWQGFSEFLLFLLPIINLPAIKQKLTKHFWRPKRTETDLLTCPVCLSSPVNTPFTTNCCGHVYCYYCIQSNLTEDPKFACLACNKIVTKIQWQET